MCNITFLKFNSENTGCEETTKCFKLMFVMLGNAFGSGLCVGQKYW